MLGLHLADVATAHPVPVRYANRTDLGTGTGEGVRPTKRVMAGSSTSGRSCTVWRVPARGNGAALGSGHAAAVLAFLRRVHACTHACFSITTVGEKE